ncbi:hypothetical protein Btru_051697 [Bulinus truncatus]|nr:hypothetical protein Btru_051697 [Bulinus truncatus]
MTRIGAKLSTITRAAMVSGDFSRSEKNIFGKKMSSGDDVIVRRARAQDYDAILRIGEVYGGKDYLPATFFRALADPDIHPLVAEVKGQVVAFIMCHFIDGGLTSIVRAGRTHPAFRKLGIMHRLDTELDKLMTSRTPKVQFILSSVRDLVFDRAAETNRQKGCVEILRKPIMSLVYNVRELTDIDPTNQLPTVTSLNYEDLKIFFTLDDILVKLFPAKRLFNNYIGYRCLESNIKHLLDANKAVCVTITSSNSELSNPEAYDTKVSMLKDTDMVTFSEWFMANAGLVYVMDIYAKTGHNEASVKAHTQWHLNVLRRMNLCDRGVFVASVGGDLSEESVRAQLRECGISDPLPESEKWKALFEKELKGKL